MFTKITPNSFQSLQKLLGENLFTASTLYEFSVLELAMDLRTIFSSYHVPKPPPATIMEAHVRRKSAKDSAYAAYALEVLC